MKLSELITTLEKTEKNKEWGVDLEKFGGEFGLALYGEYYEGEEFVAYYHQDASWICTDTRVGLKFFFLNDKLICISNQRGRKSEEYFEWISQEAKNDLFSWLIKNFVKNKDNGEGNIINMDEDISLWMAAKLETEKLNKKYNIRAIA